MQHFLRCQSHHLWYHPDTWHGTQIFINHSLPYILNMMTYSSFTKHVLVPGYGLPHVLHMTPACPICYCQAHCGERKGASIPFIQKADLLYINSTSRAYPLQLYTADIHYPFQRSDGDVSIAFTLLKRWSLNEKTLKYSRPTVL